MGRTLLTCAFQLEPAGLAVEHDMHNAVKRELRSCVFEEGSIASLSPDQMGRDHRRDSLGFPNERLLVLGDRPAFFRLYDPFRVSLADSWLDSSLGRLERR
jgi:hypothetical protein